MQQQQELYAGAQAGAGCMSLEAGASILGEGFCFHQGVCFGGSQAAGPTAAPA